MMGDIDLPHTITYIRDFAKALVRLSKRPEAYGRAWHVPSAPTVTPRQFIDLVEAEIERPIKVRPAGKWMLKLIGLFNRDVNEMVEMLYEFEEPFIIDHSQYVTTFGNGVTPHDVAIKKTVEWYRDR